MPFSLHFVITKLKQKFLISTGIIYIYKQIRWLGFFVVFLLLFCSIPNTVSAAINCRGVGTGTKVCDGIDFTISPTQAKIGDTVQISITVTDPEFKRSQAGTGVTYAIGICASGNDIPGCVTGSATKLTSVDGNKDQWSIQFPYILGGNINKAQTYSIGAAAISSNVNFGGIGGVPIQTNKQIQYGLVNIQVDAAAANGQPSLNVANTGTLVTPNISNSITKTYAITYLDGGTGKQPSAFTYDCGDGKGIKNLSSGSKTFQCSYTEIKNYNVSVQALDNSTPVKVLAEKQIVQNINGQELTQGSQTAQQSPVQSDGIIGLVNKIIAAILSFLMEALYAVFYWLVAPVIQAVLSIHSYTDTFVNVIYPGWQLIRNISNILFVVSLMAMAMGTLIRSSSYQMKSLIVQIIIGALLVNFSLVIAQAVLGIADTIQSQFLPNNVEVIRSLARDLMVTNLRDIVWNMDILKYGSFSQTVQLLFYVAMAIGAFGVFISIAAFLVIRIVMLWMLLMVSPAAYVAGILPATKGLRSKWWQQFIRYAFFTPAIAFFLNMAAVMAQQVNQQGLMQKITGADFPDSNSGGLTAFVFKSLTNVLLLVFLFASLKVASMMGVKGGEAVTKAAEKGMMSPFKYIGGKFKQGGERIKEEAELARLKKSNALAEKGGFKNKMLSKMLAPGLEKKAKQDERHHHIKDEKEMAEALAKDRVKPGGKAVEKLKQQRENEKVKKEQDKYEGESKARILSDLQDAIDKGDKIKFKALMKIATDEDYLDELKASVNALPRGVGAPLITDMDGVYAFAAGRGSITAADVDKVKRVTNKNEGDKGRLHNMTAAERVNKINNLSIEGMAGVSHKVYTSVDVAGNVTGITDPGFVDDMVTALASDPDMAKSMIGKMSKKQRKAWRELLGARGTGTGAFVAPSVTSTTARTNFDTLVP